MLPVRTVEGPEGVHAPFHVIPFDKAGACTAPVNRDLLARAALDATDVFVFSHGYNADFTTAVRHYDAFIHTFLKLREQTWGVPERAYRPLLAGVFWPSSSLTGHRDGRAAFAELATGLTRAERATARALAERPALEPADARRLAELLCALLRSEDEEPHEGPDVPPDPEALLAAAGAGRAGPTDTHELIRVATLLLMKDRAATVGAHGVADLLLRLQATPGPELTERRRLHLVGHSYGAKVMLAALSSPNAPGLDVDSVLLLQPAVSAWCFAAEGAYRPALSRVRRSLVTTFSDRDEALKHAPDERFAALGGTGPLGVEATVLDPVEPPAPYDFPADAPNHLVAIRGHDVILGHDDVASETTAWLLLNQIR